MLTMAVDTLANQTKDKDQLMSASGTFEVNLEPQQDENAPAGRMIIHKKYTGDLEGTGAGQMISKRTDGGAAVYSAIEEFEGTVNGKTGAFTLIHNGYMSSETQSLDIKILDGSGSGELANISGTMDIVQTDGEHKYILDYEL